jgi:ribosomal protein S26
MAQYGIFNMLIVVTTVLQRKPGSMCSSTSDSIADAESRCLRRLIANEAIIQDFPIRQVMINTAFLISCINEAYIVTLEGSLESKVRHKINSLTHMIKQGVYYEIWRPSLLHTRDGRVYDF